MEVEIGQQNFGLYLPLYLGEDLINDLSISFPIFVFKLFIFY